MKLSRFIKMLVIHHLLGVHLLVVEGPECFGYGSAYTSCKCCAQQQIQSRWPTTLGGARSRTSAQCSRVTATIASHVAADVIAVDTRYP